MLAAAGCATGSADFVGGMRASHAMNMLPGLLAAYRLGRQAIEAARPTLPVGATLAMVKFEAAGPGCLRDAKRHAFYGAWLETVRHDDFVGVLNYSRIVWDAKGMVPPPADAKKGGEGREIYSPSLANAVDYVHGATGRPILVTEHGLNTSDDALRAALNPVALDHLKLLIDSGTPMLGCIPRSLLDNFEWIFGYTPRYGLAAVDRATLRRIPKPSVAVLGTIARHNAL